MYSIEFSKTSKNQLNKLPQELQIRVINTLDRIKFRPFYFVKRKQGTPNYILRVGTHRVILEIKSNKLLIEVLEVGPKYKIYKK